MDHPNIARIYDAGATDDDVPYFVMELVRGDPITQYCDANHLDLDARVVLFTKVCRAAQHAHIKGVVHRDLKPSNILVSVIDHAAEPRVIDFGIAKAIEATADAETMHTALGSVIGTLEYMSPEQAGGQSDRHAQRRLLAGRHPVRARDGLAPVRIDGAAQRRPGGGAASDSRHRPADTRAALHGNACARHRRACARHRRALSRKAARRRSGLDHSEGDREGSRATLSVGQRFRGRPRPLAPQANRWKRVRPAAAIARRASCGDTAPV